MSTSVKKIFLGGLALWVLMFLGVTVLGFVPLFGQFGEGGMAFTRIGRMVSYAYGMLVSFMLARWFFKEVPRPELQDGFAAFLPILLVGLFLDAVITVPFFVKSFGGYFGDPFLWFGILLSWISFGFGALQKK